MKSEYCCETQKLCSTETLRRVIRNEGFTGRITRKKPFSKECNRKIRLEFAQEHLGKDEKYWSNAIFCDESKFNIFGSDCKVMVWRKPNQELKTSHLKSTVKHGGVFLPLALANWYLLKP